MKISDNGSGDFEQPEPGSYGATCYRIIDLGTQHGEYQGVPYSRRQVLISWELEQFMADGKPFVVSGWYTASLSEKAKLRALLESWRGVPFTKEELKGFDIEKVIGASCILNLMKTDKGKIRVSSVIKPPKGTVPPEKFNPPFFFSLDAFSAEKFAQVPDGIKKFITASPEYQKAIGGEVPDPEPVNKETGEKIPF